MTWPLVLGCAAWAGILAGLGANPLAAVALGAVVFLPLWTALDA